MPENTMDQVNTNLLNKDANAGNIQIREALSLLENRTISKQLCTLGKPFKLDFYDNVDRKLIEKDANAGNTTAQNILKLADVRICLLYTSPSPRDLSTSRMPSSA